MPLRLPVQAAAELPTAKEHYTEELKLLPAGHMHQFYEKRPGGSDRVSHKDGQGWGHLRRSDFEMVPEAWRDGVSKCSSPVAALWRLRCPGNVTGGGPRGLAPL